MAAPEFADPGFAAREFAAPEFSAPEFSATVTDIRLESRSGATVRWQMALDRTHFTPGDTGSLHAVARSGTPIEIPVLNVIRDESGDLWHIVEKPLAAGTDVLGRIAR